MSERVKLCDVNDAAVEKLPGRTEDKSGIGVHYVDAYLKPMNTKLPDGTPVKCKRRGLKITLTRSAWSTALRSSTARTSSAVASMIESRSSTSTCVAPRIARTGTPAPLRVGDSASRQRTLPMGRGVAMQ